MLYICIPAYNEAETVGVLLWRIRKVFQDYSREYEVLVFNDGSTDSTAETLVPYADVMPLTVLGGPQHVGYDRAIDALCRAVSTRTRYPRRDAMITLQADFTDQPEHLPELIKRFEGGADLVVAERTVSPTAPQAVRRMQWLAGWIAKTSRSIAGVGDPFGAFRLYRISLIRDLVKESGDAPVVRGQGWAANLDLLRRTAPLARRIESVKLEPRYDIRARETRIKPWADSVALFRAPKSPIPREADEVIRVVSRIAVLAGLLALAVPATAQDSTSAPRSSSTPPARVPWGVGELLEYDISFGKIHVGNGNMEVLPMDTVRGRDTWHTIFRLNGGIPFYRVHDKYEDWTDIHTLSSLRYRQDIDEGGYEPKRLYEIYPERREYLEVSKKDATTMQSVEHPLSDASFIYFLRTVPLRMGMDTSFSDYFRADRNPVHFKVVRRDTIKVGAGQFATIVIQPSFPSKLFCDGCKAEVWLSDDENRIVVQMKSKVSFGSLSLYLKNYKPSPTTNVPLNRVP